MSILQRCLFNEETHTGFLEAYIRNKRSNDPVFTRVKRKYTKRIRSDDDDNEDDNSITNSEKLEPIEAEKIKSYLKNLNIKTRTDRENAFKRMAEISGNRLAWIKEVKPTVAGILQEFPIYLECVELVSKMLFIISSFLNATLVIFKINEDFKTWFHHIQADRFLLEWNSIQSGIFKFARYSRNDHIRHLMDLYNEKLNENG